jgi:hypothetical protein
MTTDRMPRGPGLFRMRTGDGPPLVTNIRRLAGTDREPGSVLVTAGMALLAMLDGGLLYVVFAAQDRFIFSVKHQNVASMIQALALDVAMIIFSVLALGLARKGLPANVERALIVVCALASAFMNWTASDHTSLRSVAVYVSAPILLALVTDRVISVVRRHVLGMSEDASVWARFGQRLGRAALWAGRLLVDFRATRAGIRQAILAATPLAGQDEQEAAGATTVAFLEGEVTRVSDGLVTLGSAVMDALDTFRERMDGQGAQLARMAEDLGDVRAEVFQEARYPTKKAAFLAAYRAHADYGDRAAASRVAAELAPAAGLQAGTARSYAYAELEARAEMNGGRQA